MIKPSCRTLTLASTWTCLTRKQRREKKQLKEVEENKGKSPGMVNKAGAKASSHGALGKLAFDDRCLDLH